MNESALLGASGLLALCIIAFGIANTVVISQNLLRGDGWYGTYYGYFYSTGICLMSTTSVNVCAYGIVVNVISFLLAITVLGLMFATPSPHANVLIGAVGSLWWLAYAITATVYSKDADNQGYPEGYWREVAYALAWTIFVCYLLLALVGLGALRGDDHQGQAAKGPPAVPAAASWDAPKGVVYTDAKPDAAAAMV